jgi:hypothetical protein
MPASIWRSKPAERYLTLRRLSRAAFVESLLRTAAIGPWRDVAMRAHGAFRRNALELVGHHLGGTVTGTVIGTKAAAVQRAAVDAEDLCRPRLIAPGALQNLVGVLL